MPVAHVTMISGRTKEQKEKLAEAITDAMVTHAGARREICTVVFIEVGRDDWASGGVLVSNR
ncbi:MAG: 2-hydroxymuconate tautomerase [Nitrospinota bacterium]